MQPGRGRIRRVITGHDENGKSIVISDGLAPAVRTNHAWSNRSDQPALMLYVLIDGKFDPELASKFNDS